MVLGGSAYKSVSSFVIFFSVFLFLGGEVINEDFGLILMTFYNDFYVFLAL
jgi:hypothetical protein